MFNLNGSCWLTPGEQESVCERLLEFGLLKWDNERSLPLKSGGTTDVYLNLRNCRNTPGATAFLAECFENPLRRLKAARFVEMPSALSGVAGALSDRLRIPYVTVRDTQKTGRVSDAEIIGELAPGQQTVMFDDVVTDGETKVRPYRVCRARGVRPEALVVLVDRQQGWKAVFVKEKIGLPVWAGLTLHDVRKFLVTRGLMRRCDPEVEAKNQLIIALDGKPWDEVLPIVDRLRPSGCILKANDLLNSDNVNEVISDLSVYGRVMADPKYHDVPNTIANYCARLRATPPWAVTVHASGGNPMVKAALEGLAGTPTIVLAVTVLTSIKDECEIIYKRLPMKQVMKLAELAWNAGARGFVCSGEETAMLRKRYPEAILVIPALRSPGTGVQDQKRISTFADAKKAGGNYFVGGRQFLTATDPVAEIFRVLKYELQVEEKLRIRL